MVIKTFFLYCLFASAFILSNNNQDFYEALYSSSLDIIEKGLGKLENNKKSTTKDAYKGALLMKKSSFMKTASEKVETFKEGHQLLESAIQSAIQNPEYRFIRLTIQENAPKILKYNKNIDEDKAFVLAEFSKMDKQLQHYILDYSSQSSILKKDDLKNKLKNNF